MAKRRRGPFRERRAIDIPINAKVAPVEIENPYWTRGSAENIPRIIPATRSLRDDRLAWLHSHKHIDAAQFEAGRRMQSLYERASIGVKAMDPTNEPVDGGGMIPESLSEAVTEAVKEIARIEAVLGREGAAYARDFLAFGNSILQCATIRGVPMGHQLGYKAVAYRIREILETLVGEFGLVTK